MPARVPREARLPGNDGGRPRLGGAEAPLPGNAGGRLRPGLGIIEACLDFVPKSTHVSGPESGL